MKTFLAAFLFILVLPLTLLAQGGAGRVTGTLVDASKAPVGFANVVLLTAPDSSLVTGTTTDMAGLFVLERVPAGRFILRISMVGYPTKFIPNVAVAANTPEVALGTVTLGAASTRLGEVEITAERPLVEFELDKRVVNVTQDVNAQSGTVAEVMQNVPSLTVDIDGNVSMRGSSSVTILVDGKRSALSNLTMDQIPANLIESIELITNPSSKYDPEGTSGIINLVLKKEKKPGFHGSASVTAATYDNYNASLNLNYRYHKWSLNGGYDFRQRTRPGTSNSFTTNFYEAMDSISYRLQESGRNSRDLSHNFRFGADYYLTPKHTLSASALYQTGQDESANNILYRFLDENSVLTGTSTRHTTEEEDENAVDLTVGYRQTFEQPGRELTADIVYNTNVDDELSIFREDGLLAEGLPEVQHTLVDDKNTRLVAQADYVHPVSEDSRIETGFRSSYQQLDEDARFFNFNHATGALDLDPNQSNHFVYDEQVYSVYGNYSNKLKSISYQVGLRAEQTITKSDQRTQDIVVDNSYFSLFPSVFITNDFNPNNKLQFSYSRRINRPRSRTLNPFVDLSDRFNVDFGNPNLKPEFINSLELGYLRYWGDVSLNGSLFYRHTTDGIERFRSQRLIVVDGDSLLGTETTFLNISNNTAYGAEVGLDYPITKWWRLNGSISGFRTQLSTMQGDTELTANQFSWNSKLNTTLTVWEDMDIQLSAFYRAPTVDIQGRMEQMFSADFGVKKDVLNKNATVSLRVTDIFNTRQFNFLSYGPGFETNMENRRQSRIFYLGFTYRFNSDRSSDREQQDRDEEEGSMEEDFGQ